MNTNPVKGDGTRERPWQLKTPNGSSEYQMYKDESAPEFITDPVFTPF